MTSISEKSNIDSIVTINTRTNVKYGDSDVVSKRRKNDIIFSTSSSTNTVISSPVKTICRSEYLKLEKPILPNLPNRVFIDDKYLNKNNDFKGGLINNETIACDLKNNFSRDNQNEFEKSTKSVASQTTNSDPALKQYEGNTSTCEHNEYQVPFSTNFITQSPSGNSCGFGNTFRILENQIKSKNIMLSPATYDSFESGRRSSYLRRISEEILNDDFNNFASSQNPTNYVSTLNFKKTNDFICINDVDANNEEEIDEEYKPTYFELELNAMQRVKELLNNSKPEIIKKRLNQDNDNNENDDDGSTDMVNSIGLKKKLKIKNENSISAPMSKLLYGFKPFISKLNYTKQVQKLNNTDDIGDVVIDDKNYHCNEIDLMEENVSNCVTSSNYIENGINENLIGTCTSKNNNKDISGEILLEFPSDDSDIAYHIAKGKDGKKYLKIVKNLLLDKVLCGNRVSQMTRAYDDIEAVTRLLEEKEKDLELTVQIGKELLTQNNRLENRIAELEQELKLSNEDRAQLVHDLHQKNELISVLTNDFDDGNEAETPTYSKSVTSDLLQRKIISLQDENKTLKIEASQLVKQTDEIEEQERKLMEDITSQLNSAHSNYDGLNIELERQKEENRLQHEQIISVTARLTEAEMRLHQLTTENDEQVSLLSITKENQNLLASELAEFKQRYQEVLALLQEAQEYMRKNRKKQQPHARSSFIQGIGGIPQSDSLHLELMESSMYSENSLDSGIGIENRLGSLGINNRLNVICGIGNVGPISAYKKIFETVQCATKNGNYSDSISHLSTMSLSSSNGPRMSAMPYTGYCSNPAGSYHRPSSVYSGSTYPIYDSSLMGAKTMSCESLASQSDDGYPQQSSGVPGAPGAKDLEAALKRLTPGEVLARRAMLAHAPLGTYNYDEQNTRMSGLPLGIRTPDSIMSTGSSLLSNISDSTISERSNSTGNQSHSTNQWRLPEKLQIIKPMEGSQTLGHWSRLATPTLSGLLEERPGVTIRGGRGLDDLGLQLYSLSDVEEDVDELPPGKQFQDSGFTYTLSMSNVMHPDDGLVNDLSFLSQSQLSSRMASNSTSRQPSCPQTPRGGLSRRNSCSTFSVNMGLASMLNERGIKAVTPSALNTPAGPNFSPTVTPCNSPEGSPTRCMSPEPLFGLLSTGADLIRRKLIGDYDRPTQHQQHKINIQNKQQKIMLSRLEKRALRSLRLLEKVESVGLENIIATQPSAMSQLASGIASRSASPMAQLTSLKNFQAINNGMVDDLQFDRNQIRAILNKGLSNDSLKNLNNENEVDNTINYNKLRTDAQLESNFETALTTPLTEQSSVLVSSSLKTIYSKKDELHASTAQNSNTCDSVSSIDIRLKQVQRQKSRRNLKNGQRSDLGTVGGRIRPDLGKVDQRNNYGGSETNSQNSTLERKSTNKNKSNINIIMNEEEFEVPAQQSMTQSFVGSISSLFFGRKGGWS